jgi:hypothetical protein
LKLARSEAELSQRNQQFKACAAANDEISGIALDVLDRYENKGCFERMAQVEPFTGIKRARITRLHGDRCAQSACGVFAGICVTTAGST